MDIERFTTRSFDVDAVQITSNNLHEVAKWCGGIVKGTGVYVMGEGPDMGRHYIDLLVPTSTGVEKVIALPGSWILAGADKVFRHHNAEEFQKTFVPKIRNDEILDLLAELVVEMEEERYQGASNPFLNLGTKYVRKLQDLFQGLG